MFDFGQTYIGPDLLNKKKNNPIDVVPTISQNTQRTLSNGYF